MLQRQGTSMPLQFFSACCRIGSLVLGYRPRTACMAEGTGSCTTIAGRADWIEQKAALKDNLVIQIPFTFI
jgi:hypothetical protein